MSHELLLVAGDLEPTARARRRRLVIHAAAQVPGAVDWVLAENEHATLAIVTTYPSGGSAILNEEDAQGTVVTLGASETAAKTAARDQAGQRLGAECGHIKVILHRDATVAISTDGTGFLPSYWAATDGEFLFATHLASLVSLGADPRPDDAAMLEYLVMLQPLGRKTILRQVALFPAGGQLRLVPRQAPRMEINHLYAPSDEQMVDAEAVSEFSSVWTTVIQDMFGRTCGSRAAMGLSGGLDSRAIGLESVRNGFRPHAFTYGTLETRAGQVACEIARLLELDHTMLPVTEGRLLKEPSTTSMMLDGAHSPAEMYEFWFADSLRTFTDVVINGHAGGPLWGDDKAIGIDDRSLLIDRLTERYSPEIAQLQTLLNEDAGAAAHEALHTSLSESLQEWDIAARPDMVIFWNIYNRQFRWGNMLTSALRRSGLRIEAPFLDSRFLRFSARLTPAQRMNGRLYLQVHRKVFSATARVSRSDDGNAPQHLSHLYWSGNLSFERQFAHFATQHPISAGRRAGLHLQRVAAARLQSRGLLPHLSDHYTARHAVFPADLWLRTSSAYRQRLLEFAEATPPLSIVSAKSMDRVLEDLRTGCIQVGALRIAKIATLQAWIADYARRAELRQSAE